MHEDFDTRLWADHGQQFSRAMSNLIASARVAFERLAEHQFSAPWKGGERSRTNAPCTNC